MKCLRTRAAAYCMAICMVFSLVTTQAQAALDRSSQYLSAYTASAIAKSGGKIAIDVVVRGRGSMDAIGADRIHVYESKDGSSFYRVATYRAADYPELLTSGTAYTKTAVTYSGKVGYYYQADIYVYAEKDGGSDIKLYETNVVKAVN